MFNILDTMLEIAIVSSLLTLNTASENKVTDLEHE